MSDESLDRGLGIFIKPEAWEPVTGGAAERNHRITSSNGLRSGQEREKLSLRRGLVEYDERYL